MYCLYWCGWGLVDRPRSQQRGVLDFASNLTALAGADPGVRASERAVDQVLCPEVLCGLYADIWQDFRVSAAGETPQGDTCGVDRLWQQMWLSIIVGDPIHDAINLRRKVRAVASDGLDMTRDH